MNRFFAPFIGGRGAVGLLVLRIIMGAGLMFHGWGKIQNPFGWMGDRTGAAPGFLQALAALSEFGGGLAMILGLLTPLAAFGIVCTMGYAAYTHISRGQPFVGKGGPSWELPALYFVMGVLMLLCGPGRLSLDALLFGRSRAAVREAGVHSEV